MNTTHVSETALAPLIKYCNENPGAKSELALKMTEAVGYTIQRQVVEGWMHKDPEKRVEPKLGMGIVLMRVGGIMLGTRRPLNLGVVIKHAMKAEGKNGHGKE